MKQPTRCHVVRDMDFRGQMESVRRRKDSCMYDSHLVSGGRGRCSTPMLGLLEEEIGGWRGACWFDC